MPYEVKKINGRYRLCKPGTKKIALNNSGTAIDGGGHTSKSQAQRQVKAIMSKE